jgi:uncharacterized metal-binding protein
MRANTNKKSVLVVPCSGIGKVHGLISREATYLVTDEMAPQQTETICLALLVKGDPEALDAVKVHPCITIDGCPKACAEKNVIIAGASPVKAIRITEILKKRRGVKPGNPIDLSDEGWAITRDVASLVADTAMNLRGGEEEIR